MTLRTRKYLAALASAAAVGIVAASILDRPLVVAAQQPDLAARIAALEAQQREIMRQLDEIKLLLQQPRPAQPAAAPAPVSASTPQDFVLSVDNAASKGRADAKVVMIEFSDFQCQFCGNYSRQTYPAIDRDYVESGKVRYVFRHFPIERLHPLAFKAAEAGECARTQGKFWPLHDRLFANQQLLAPGALVDHAAAIGLTAAPFQACLAGQAAVRIRADLAAGTQLGITGTPTFFVGVAQKDGKVHVLQRIVGAKPITVFQSVFDRMLPLADGAK